jgi:hypothetical protein
MSVILSQFNATAITSIIPIAVTSSGSVYAQGNATTQNIYVYNSSGTQTAVITATDWYFSFCFDSSNNKIYCAGVSTFGIINTTNNTLSTFTSSGINGVAIGPDGFVYATTNSGYKIQKINPTTGAQTNIFTDTGTIPAESYGTFGTCAFDNNGFLYCITRGVGYIYKFNTSGTRLGLFSIVNSAHGNTFGLTFDTVNYIFYASATGTPGAIYKIDKYGSSSLYTTTTNRSHGVFYNKNLLKIYATTSTNTVLSISPFVPSTGTTYVLINRNLLNYYPFNSDMLNYVNPSSPVNDTTSNLVSISTATTALNNGTGSASFPGISNNWIKINKLNFATTGLTISAWVKYYMNTGSGGTKRIFDFGNGYGVDGLLISFVSDSGSEIEFFVKGASYIAQIAITNYNWHNYCLVVNNSNASIYIDGVIQTFRLNRSGPSLTVMPVNLPTSKDLVSNFIGNSNWSSNESLYGHINNFLIFNRIFTDEEIAYTSNINNTILVKPPVTFPVSNEKLLHYYRFETDYLNYSTYNGTSVSTGISDASASGVSISAGSLLLPGTSSQSFILPPILFGAFGITIAFWMKCVAIPTNNARIFDFATETETPNKSFSFGFPTTGAMQVKIENTYLGDNSHTTDLNYTLADTNWHHYVLTINTRGTLTFYVDGVEKVSSLNYIIYPALSRFTRNYIGKSPVVTNGYLNAYLSQFFILNRVVTANELLTISDSRYSITPETTVLYENTVISPSNLVYGILSKFSVSYSNPYLVTSANYSLKLGTTVLNAKPYTGTIRGVGGRSSTVDDSGNIWTYAYLPFSSTFGLTFLNSVTKVIEYISLEISSETGLFWGQVRYYKGLVYVFICSGYYGAKGFLRVINPHTKTFVYSNNTDFYHAFFDIGNDGFIYAVSATWASDPYSTQWLVDKINPTTYERTTLIYGNSTMFEGVGSSTNALTSIAFDSDDNIYIGTQGGYLTKWNKSGTRLMTPIQIATPNGNFDALFFNCHKATNTLYARGNGSSYVYAINTTTFSKTIFANATLDYSQMTVSIDNNENRLYFNNYRFDLNPVPTITFNSAITVSANVLQIYDPSDNALGNRIILDGIYPCFKEGSKILRFDPETDMESYVPVETLRRGDLIQTATCGYKTVAFIGRGVLRNPVDDPDRKNRLYRFRDAHKKHPPLYLTGEHCLLYKEKDIPESKRREVREHMGDDYITETYYRVPACLDDKGEPYKAKSGSEEPVTIWHFALEHNNLYNNYAVWANGILVETCSIDFLTKKSSMELV